MLRYKQAQQNESSDDVRLQAEILSEGILRGVSGKFLDCLETLFISSCGKILLFFLQSDYITTDAKFWDVRKVLKNLIVRR